MEGVDPKHAKEVARLVRKLSRLRLLGVLGAPSLLGLALLLYGVHEPDAAGLGLLFGTPILLTVGLLVASLSRSLRSLREAQHPPVLAAFHSPNSGYVFISARGIFVERFLDFVPIRGAKFEYGSRQLVLAVIRDNKYEASTEYAPIDVPPGVSGEPLELFCASVNALPAGAPSR
ncbi:MAG TPA: hypothetical protein VE153_39260 [Myxococcus sp.]|nr:hypothetical protein [Myxococcus sp.]